MRHSEHHETHTIRRHLKRIAAITDRTADIVYMSMI